MNRLNRNRDNRRAKKIGWLAAGCFAAVSFTYWFLQWWMEDWEVTLEKGPGNFATFKAPPLWQIMESAVVGAFVTLTLVVVAIPMVWAGRRLATPKRQESQLPRDRGL